MNAPTDAAAVREAAARLCEQEASDYRHGQRAAVERGEKMYRMGQKDAALLLAAAIRQLDLPGGEEVERLRAAISWLQPPFVDENTSVEELRQRIAFMLADVARVERSGEGGGA